LAGSNNAPGVFLSHATEDNDRFARRFAARLREGGCRVWFDEWELLPGDSLVDKVFDEGLKDADALVIVLSKYSIDKPWVREELNAGFIKRLEGRCKLIPVLLDGVEVPEVLRSTVWQGITDLDNYEDELDRILRAIHDDRQRVEPGEQPGYTGMPALPGLYSTDTLVLKIGGDLAVRSDGTLVQSPDVLALLQEEGVTPEAFLDSLQVLEEHGYADVHRTLGSGIEAASAFSITTVGLELYATNFVDAYDGMWRQVASDLVNSDRTTDGQIAAAQGIPRMLVEHIFDVFAAQGLVRVTKMTGPSSFVHNVSPQLGRMLAEGT
jgi:hypothetical protein